MRTDPYCQQRNCSPLNALFSDVWVTLRSQGVHPLWGVKQAGWGNTIFSRKMRQYHSPGGADCCCIFKQVVVLSATCFHVELEQFSTCLRFAAGLSASAGLSCITQFYQYSVYVILINLEAQSFRSLQSVSNPQI